MNEKGGLMLCRQWRRERAGEYILSEGKLLYLFLCTQTQLQVQFCGARSLIQRMTFYLSIFCIHMSFVDL